MRTVSKNQNDEHRYDDMLKKEHHVSLNHPAMSKEQRAAQFSPFSALSGYEESIEEAERITAEMIDLSDEEKEIIDHALRNIQRDIKEHPCVTVTYFVQDPYKEGGSYRQITQNIKKIEQGKLFFKDTVIDFAQIISIKMSQNKI